MTDYEVYDKFFADEEYDLKNTSVYEYSYWGGWNNALKRASILIRNEIRPNGEWVEKHSDYGVYYQCSICHKMPPNYECDYKEGAIKTNFCPNCGAEMKGGAE